MIITILIYNKGNLTLGDDNLDYCGIAHPGDNSKSGLLIELYFTSGTLFLLFIQKPCQFIAKKN